jgi:hypothetical protein
MTYTVISHDAWGSADVGSFASLEQAREVFQALQNDRWFLRPLDRAANQWLRALHR